MREKFRLLSAKYPEYLSVIKYVSLFVFSALFLLLFSLWTSPFYKNWYGCDASFFTMAGRGITEGWVPYRDFFDLKGPYFFFIEALGQLFFKGRSGAYIIQIFSLFFALVIMIKTCRLFISAKKTGFIVSIFLIFHVATLWGGNTLEEYVLPLSLLSIYVILKDLKNSQNINARSAIITGICFGIIAFSKISVSAPIVGLVLAVMLYFVKNRRFRDLFEFLLYAFLGVLLGITPIFVYFAYHKCLIDMLYAVFVFAFKRANDFGTPFNLRWELKISGCYFALLFAICQLFPKGRLPKSKTEKMSENNVSMVYFLLSAVTFISIVTAVALHFGDPFIYYFTTVYPVLMLAFIALFMIYDPLIIFRSWRLDIPLVAFLLTMSYFASHTASTLDTVIYDRDNTYYQTYCDLAKEMGALIPECDRDSVYSINIDMQWFEINDILPYYSYTINLQFFVALDPRIEENIINKITTDPPKWIVIGGNLSEYLPNLNDVVMPRYTKVYENPYGALYLIN